MSYEYQKERPSIFTKDGQVMFLGIRDTVFRLCKAAGAVRAQETMSGQCGSSWQMIACLDRMVELGDIREVTDSAKCWAQHRVFVLVEKTA